jgi:hypothetical protein
MFAIYSEVLPVISFSRVLSLPAVAGEPFRRYTASITQRQFVQSLTFGSLARANSKISDSKELIGNPGKERKELLIFHLRENLFAHEASNIADQTSSMSGSSLVL